jgi:glycine oxidase
LSQSRVIVVGAGVAGLACALELCDRGYAVEVVERGRALGDGCCSWMAGGMLAPWCERASTDPLVAEWGAPAIDWWAKRFAGTVRRGSLVVAQPRDAGELTRFADRTERYEWLDGDRLGELEPALAGRFRRALFFPDEAHLEPRRALPALADALRRHGVSIRFGVDFKQESASAELIVDCRGLAARDALPDLRGVRGEMLVLRSRDIELSRPVRLLHPRIPLYIVPRGDGVFMVGATMVESDARGGPTVRSSVELLNAAYTLHPAFAEAEILEINADVRPAFADNLPDVRLIGRTLYANGLFRHGFLLSPHLAQRVAERALDLLPPLETIDADLRQRRPA